MATRASPREKGIWGSCNLVMISDWFSLFILVLSFCLCFQAKTEIQEYSSWKIFRYWSNDFHCTVFFQTSEVLEIQELCNMDRHVLSKPLQHLTNSSNKYFRGKIYDHLGRLANIALFTTMSLPPLPTKTLASLYDP